MSRTNDVFDIQEWKTMDPLAPAGIDDSPETLTITPQPVVSYTTVGSLVRTDMAPQFTAPVRIQREGASRRPPPTPMHPRAHDGYLGVRGTSQQHGMHSSSPTSWYNNQSHSPYPSSYPPFALSEAEKSVINKMHSKPPPPPPPSMRSGNVPQIPRGSTTRPAEFVGEPPSQGNSTQSSLQNVDKMQTLLGLSQYPNPMQQLAKDRLSGFAAAKSQSSTSNTAPVPVSQQPFSYRNTSSNKPTASVTQQSSMYQTGSNNNFPASVPQQPSIYGETTSYQSYGSSNASAGRDYTQTDPDSGSRFPPPGLPFPSRSNIFDEEYHRTIQSEFNTYNGPAMNMPQQHLNSGRPQPLTAGPPGPRNYNGGFAPQQPPPQSTLDHSNSRYEEAPLQLPAGSPWDPLWKRTPFVNKPGAHSDIRNTMPLDEVKKYYPHGFPSDMTGSYSRLPMEEHKANIGLIPTPDKNDPAVKKKKQDEWFYSGVREFNKTPSEHIVERDRRDLHSSYGIGPQPEEPLPPIEKMKTLTVAEVQAMHPSAAAAPILGAVFGNLLAYADPVPSSSNRAILSKFAPPAPWTIDSGDHGNESFFSEDDGPPPGRLARDPRYQRFSEQEYYEEEEDEQEKSL